MESMLEAEKGVMNNKVLLTDLQRLLRSLRDDLRNRSEEVQSAKEDLRSHYQEYRRTERTLASYEEWREEFIDQVAVAWILGCVFVRYMEDNELIEDVWLAGQGDRMRQAYDNHELYFRKNPAESDRDYIKFVFRNVAENPVVCDILGEKHNPLWKLDISGDGGRNLLAFWQAIDPQTGKLRRFFGSVNGDTRFLGDLYQDLSEDARKRYALLQTPEFVEEFILDRTLEPAIKEFGLCAVRIIDPTCGSGHFLLGAFHRIFNHWKRCEPDRPALVITKRTLDAIFGVDINPFAVAIARFGLLIAALHASGQKRLRDVSDFSLHLACGDSLLHGRRFSRNDQLLLPLKWGPDVYAEGDYEEATRMLNQQYHAVVGNPPSLLQ